MTSDLPDVARLRAKVEQAVTPREMMAVLDMADAIGKHGRRLHKSFAAEKLLDAARDAYRAEIEAGFARLGVICRAAELLPDQGSRVDLSPDRISRADFGIGLETAARWKRQGAAVVAVDLDTERERWHGRAQTTEPGAWIEPTISTLIAEATAGERLEPVDTPPLPIGRYRCIVIDPPWPIVKLQRQARPLQGTSLDYPTMTLEQIAELDIPGLAGDGCHLYLWVTHRFIRAGFDIFDRWGATYECLLTWRKNVGFTPYSWMYDTEHVLFGRVGSLPLDTKGQRLSFDAPGAGHSIKPDVFYERVVAASPAPRLEMFARRPREGFAAWGNEVAS